MKNTVQNNSRFPLAIQSPVSLDTSQCHPYSYYIFGSPHQCIHLLPPRQKFHKLFNCRTTSSLQAYLGCCPPLPCSKQHRHFKMLHFWRDRVCPNWKQHTCPSEQSCKLDHRGLLHSDQSDLWSLGESKPLPIKSSKRVDRRRARSRLYWCLPFLGFVETATARHAGNISESKTLTDTPTISWIFAVEYPFIGCSASRYFSPRSDIRQTNVASSCPCHPSHGAFSGQKPDQQSWDSYPSKHESTCPTSKASEWCWQF